MGSVWRRAIVLFLLGSIRQSLDEGTPRLIELSSALQPIALAYVVTSYLAGRAVRTQVAVGVLIVAGYALALAFIPAPGVPAGSYEKNHNLVTAVDLALLGRSHPAGWGTVLSAIPTIATTLVGLLVGQILLSSADSRAKAGRIALAAGGCLLCGYALAPFVPVIMKLWTASYALVATGWACLLFLAFYWIVDVRGWRRWTFPLAVIGLNALAAYLLPTFVPLGRITGVFVRPLAKSAGQIGPVLLTGATLLAGWLLLWWMHRRKIYLKA
jgi:predicted acyltransferase